LIGRRLQRNTFPLRMRWLPRQALKKVDVTRLAFAGKADRDNVRITHGGPRAK